MTYIDSQVLFDNAAAVTVTRNSTNVYDTSPLGSAYSTLAANTGRNMGAGEPIFLVVLVTVAFTAAGAATMDIQFVSSASSTLSSPNVHIDTGVIAKATLVAGYIPIFQALPRNGPAYLQYLGLIYTIATGPMTAGKVTAFITKDAQDLNTYVKAFLVD
jgi:hypothetical protein